MFITKSIYIAGMKLYERVLLNRVPHGHRYLCAHTRLHSLIRTND